MSEQMTPEEWAALPDSAKIDILAAHIKRISGLLCDMSKTMLATAEAFEANNKAIEILAKDYIERHENADFNSRFDFDADGRLQTRRGE